MLAIDRFNNKTDHREDCIIWTAKKDLWGYGRFWYNKRFVSAHRWIYEYEVGIIPDGLEIDHLCNTPECVNTAHMEPVTTEENNKRRKDRKRFCKRGHEYNDNNTYITKNGVRQCRLCRSTLRKKRRLDLKNINRS
jgi:hypothetical protein